MLSTRDLQEIVGRVVYKPGWSFRVYDGRWEWQHCSVTFPVLDAYDQTKTIDLDVHSGIGPFDTEKGFLDWLLRRIARIEVHEAREFFKVDGRVYDDPHADGADRDL